MKQIAMVIFCASLAIAIGFVLYTGLDALAQALHAGITVGVNK
ncbi:hypothetical protein [Burkholderia anthina]|nr:hypothetical protein [Burkholderia anthina]